MFYSNNRDDVRRPYFDSWQKYKGKQGPLTPLEQQLVAVISDHPEYQAIFESKNPDLNKDFLPELGETNPFLHLGLHLAVREQVATNRPAGIRSYFQQLVLKLKDPLQVEHLIMEQLAHCLWYAERNKTLFNEQEYILAIQNLQ